MTLPARERERERTASTSEDGRTARAAAMRETRRRAVLDASLRVFSARGYHATRISDLIEEAGIARGTFYLYFESKNAIFHELLDELLDRIRASVDGVETGAGAAPLRDQLLVIVRRVLATFHERPELTRLVLRSAPGLDAEIDRKLSAFYEQIHAWLAESLVNAQRLGLARPLDVDAVAWSILGSVKQLVERAIDSRASDADLDRITAALLDLHLGGLVAR